MADNFKGFTNAELDVIRDALQLARASNKRMQTSKPKFTTIFQQIEKDIDEVTNKLTTIPVIK